MESLGPIKKGRNFRLVADEELPSLLEILSRYLPESLKFHQTLLTYIKNKVWEFHFYVADGWPEIALCLHFPATTFSQHDSLYRSFSVFCPTAARDKLHLLREEDVLINWYETVDIAFVKHDIAEELYRLYSTTGTTDDLVIDMWACESPGNLDQIEDKLSENHSEVLIKSLLPEHVEKIYALYPARDIECKELFFRLIKILPAAGVFVDGQLAAWMLQSYYGALFSMQTRPEFRRKGYGTRIARYMMKTVADRGYIPFVLIRRENKASQDLYEHLRCKKLYLIIYRATFTPFKDAKSLAQTGITQNSDFSNIVRQFEMEQRIYDIGY